MGCSVPHGLFCSKYRPKLSSSSDSRCPAPRCSSRSPSSAFSLWRSSPKPDHLPSRPPRCPRLPFCRPACRERCWPSVAGLAASRPWQALTGSSGSPHVRRRRIQVGGPDFHRARPVQLCLGWCRDGAGPRRAAGIGRGRLHPPRPLSVTGLSLRAARAPRQNARGGRRAHTAAERAARAA